MNKNNPLSSFLEIGLRHLYSSKKQILESLEAMAKNSYSSILCDTFARHREETAQHIREIEEAFQQLNFDINKTKTEEAEGFLEKTKEALKNLTPFNFAEKNKAMEGIISEAKNVSKHFADTEVADLVLAVEGRMMEHFEIGSYYVLVAILDRLGYRHLIPAFKRAQEHDQRVRDCLDEIIEEEVNLLSNQRGNQSCCPEEAIIPSKA